MLSHVRASVLLLAVVLGFCVPSAAAQQAPAAGGQMRLGVVEVRIGDATRKSVQAAGRENDLNRFLEGMNSQMEQALKATRMFAIVTWDDTKTVLAAQERNANGNYDDSDPKAAKPFKMAGCQYIVVTHVTDFQDHSATRDFNRPGKDAPTLAHRRTLRAEAAVKLLNATTGELADSRKFYSELELPESRDAREGQNGTLTDKILADMRQELTSKVASGLALLLMPVKVLTNNGGILMLSHTAGAGLRPGQIFDAYALGEEILNEATGEKIAEETKVGEVQVTEALEKFSRGQVVSGTVAKGNILRPRMDAAGNIIAQPLRTGPGVTTAPPAAPPSGGGSAGNPPATVVPMAAGGSVRGGAPNNKPAVDVPASGEGRTVAIFIKNRAQRQGVADDRVTVIEDFLANELTQFGFRVLRREDVVNKVSKFAAAGANAGGADLTALVTDGMLSDATSALRLTQNLGAEMFFTGQISSYDKETRTDKDQGTENTKYTLRVTYQFLDTALGASLQSGKSSMSDQIRQTQNNKTDRDPLDGLLEKCAEEVGAKLKGVIPPAADTAKFELPVNASVRDFQVPDIEVRDGAYVYTDRALSVTPANAVCSIDGFGVGSTPVNARVGRGAHLLELSGPGIRTFAVAITAQPGPDGTLAPYNIQVQLDNDALARWRSQLTLLQGLKAEAKLTDAQVEAIKGLAQMFRQSGFKVDVKNDYKIDSQVPPSVWVQN